MKAVLTVLSICPRKGFEANLGEGHLDTRDQREIARQIGGEATS